MAKSEFKIGRPFEGLTEPVMTRVTRETKQWLAALVHQSGIREGELVRRVLDAARKQKWIPEVIR